MSAQETIYTVQVFTSSSAGVQTLVDSESARNTDEAHAVRTRLSRRYPFPGYIIVTRPLPAEGS